MSAQKKTFDPKKRRGHPDVITDEIRRDAWVLKEVYKYLKRAETEKTVSDREAAEAFAGGNGFAALIGGDRQLLDANNAERLKSRSSHIETANGPLKIYVMLHRRSAGSIRNLFLEGNELVRDPRVEAVWRNVVRTFVGLDPIPVPVHRIGVRITYPC